MLCLYRLNRYQSLADDAVCFQVLQDTAAFIAEVGSELSKLPGFDVQDTCLWDWMHCSPLGIEGYSNGATLLELVLEGRWGVFGGPWKIRVGIALKRAFTAFKAFYAGAGLAHSQQQFTAASLSVASGQGYQPNLKGKAHNTMCVTRWLSELLRHDDATAHRRGPGRATNVERTVYVVRTAYVVRTSHVRRTFVVRTPTTCLNVIYIYIYIYI